MYYSAVAAGLILSRYVSVSPKDKTNARVCSWFELVRPCLAAASIVLKRRGLILSTARVVSRYASNESLTAISVTDKVLMSSCNRLLK